MFLKAGTDEGDRYNWRRCDVETAGSSGLWLYISLEVNEVSC